MEKPVYCPKCAHQFAHDYAPAFVSNVPYSYCTADGSYHENGRIWSYWRFRCGWCGTEGEISVVTQEQTR